jgi:hypothetical protein
MPWLLIIGVPTLLIDYQRGLSVPATLLLTQFRQHRSI